MAKGYWIARVDVEDLEQYREGYVRGNGPALAKYGGKVIVRAGGYENPEGTSRSRNLVVEFPSYQGGAGLLSLRRVPATRQDPGRRLEL